METRKVLRAACAALVMGAGAAAACGQPAFRGFGGLRDGGAISRARAVSADGSVVVGESGSSASDGVEGVLWTRGRGLERLGFPTPEFGDGQDFPQSQALGISADGRTVVGRYIIGRTGDWQAVAWGPLGGVRRLGTFGRITNASAYAASADGTMIAGAGEQLSGGGEAFRWCAGTGYEALGYLPPSGVMSSTGRGITPDGNTIVGSSAFFSDNPDQPIAQQAVVWTPGGGMTGLDDLAGGLCDSEALAIAADGSAIVGYGTSEAGREAVMWAAGGLTSLGDLPGGPIDARALSISGDGSIVVGVGTTERGEEAFIWDAEAGMRTLSAFAGGELGLDLSGWLLEVASDISDDGSTIVGWGVNPAGRTEGFVMTIPAPSATAALGMLAFWASRRRRI